MATAFQREVRHIVDTQLCDITWKKENGEVVMYFPNRGSEFQVYNVTTVDGRQCLQNGIMKCINGYDDDVVCYPGDDIEDTLKVDDYTPGDVLWIHPVKTGVMCCNITTQDFYSECNDRYDTPYFVFVGEEEFHYIG